MALSLHDGHSLHCGDKNKLYWDWRRGQVKATEMNALVALPTLSALFLYSSAPEPDTNKTQGVLSDDQDLPPPGCSVLWMGKQWRTRVFRHFVFSGVFCSDPFFAGWLGRQNKDIWAPACSEAGRLGSCWLWQGQNCGVGSTLLIPSNYLVLSPSTIMKFSSVIAQFFRVCIPNYSQFWSS